MLTGVLHGQNIVNELQIDYVKIMCDSKNVIIKFSAFYVCVEKVKGNGRVKSCV